MTGRDEGPLREPPAASWSTHALLTRAALKSFPWPRLEDPVIVTGIEDFLQRAKPELTALILWYWGLLAKRAGSPSRMERPPENVRTEADFLSVLKLHPNTTLEYVRLSSPGEVDPHSPHDPSRDGPPGALYLDSPVGTAITAYQVLFTYSDEPDWGMDQDLFRLENHPYGAAPFGLTDGIGSQVPFHMAFLHESPLLMRIFPVLAKCFLPERVRVFFALAGLAFAKECDYWGWRFTAWAMHYLQDLTTPYHARPFPPPLIPAIATLVRMGIRRSLHEKIQHILKTHHVLFEGMVHLMLNEAVKKRFDHPFLSALQSRGDPSAAFVPGSSPTELGRVIRTASETAARLASKIDSALVALFSNRRINDTGYRTGTDLLRTNLHILTCVAQETTAPLVRFLDPTSECLAVTGEATRYVVRRLVS